MLPKWKQYKHWSLLNKYTFWGFWFALFSIALGIFAILPRSDETVRLYQAVVKNENKTNVVPVKVRLTHWLGDKEPFVTVYFKNRSEQPANGFSSTLIEGKHVLSFSESRVSSAFYSGRLSLSAKQELGIPMAPIRELKSRLADVVRDGKIVGFGMTSELPAELRRELKAEYVRDGIGAYSVNSYPIGLSYSYRNIFGDEIKKLTSFFVYIDRTRNSLHATPTNVGAAEL